MDEAVSPSLVRKITANAAQFDKWEQLSDLASHINARIIAAAATGETYCYVDCPNSLRCGVVAQFALAGYHVEITHRASCDREYTCMCRAQKISWK